jgi:hypothetical protein
MLFFDEGAGYMLIALTYSKFMPHEKAPVITPEPVTMYFSLRRHYPDQILRVYFSGDFPPLSHMDVVQYIVPILCHVW